MPYAGRAGAAGRFPPVFVLNSAFMAATQPAKVSAEAARPAKSPGDAPPPSSVDCDACTAACGAAGALPPRELPAVAAAGPPAAPLPAAAAALRHGSAAGFHSRAPPVPA